MKILIIISCIALSKAQLFGRTNILQKQVSEEELQQEPISPYAFSYTADAGEGSSARQESADSNGVVRGSYSLVSEDGNKRIVTYVADKNGFRAQVQTNEPGTESKSPANVDFQSSQLPAEEIALRVGPRPIEQKPEIQTFGIKTYEQKLETPVFRTVPRAIVLNRPVVDQTLLQQRILTEIPLQKRLETNVLLPELIQTQHFKQIETPIKLLSKIPKIHTLRTEVKPIELELQKREEQNFDRF